MLSILNMDDGTARPETSYSSIDSPAHQHLLRFLQPGNHIGRTGRSFMFLFVSTTIATTSQIMLSTTVAHRTKAQNVSKRPFLLLIHCSSYSYIFGYYWDIIRIFQMVSIFFSNSGGKKKLKMGSLCGGVGAWTWRQQSGTSYDEYQNGYFPRRLQGVFILFYHLFQCINDIYTEHMRQGYATINGHN